MKCLCCVFLTFLILIVVVPIVLFIGFYKPPTAPSLHKSSDRIVNFTQASSTLPTVDGYVLGSEMDSSEMELIEGKNSNMEEDADSETREIFNSENLTDYLNENLEKPKKAAKPIKVTAESFKPLRVEQKKVKLADSEEFFEEEEEEIVVTKKNRKQHDNNSSNIYEN